MNTQNLGEKFAHRAKACYPVGTRILLQSMGEDPRPVEENTRGTVMAVDDMGTIHCDFDNGRSLGLILGEDQFRKLTPQELAEERNEMSEDVPKMRL